MARTPKIITPQRKVPPKVKTKPRVAKRARRVQPDENIVTVNELQLHTRELEVLIDALCRRVDRLKARVEDVDNTLQKSVLEMSRALLEQGQELWLGGTMEAPVHEAEPCAEPELCTPEASEIGTEDDGKDVPLGDI